MFADKPGFVARQMLLALILIRCGGPSAVRMRTAAKQAFSLPFVPVRQLTICHLASASMSSAAIDRISGMCKIADGPKGPIAKDVKIISD